MKVTIHKKVRRLIFDWWMIVPAGHLLRFWHGSQRITLTKNLWVVTDSGTGTAEDYIPISLVSKELHDEMEKRLIKKYKISPVS